MQKFRWSKDGGLNWTVVSADLPYTIPGVGALDSVLVEPIGSAVANLSAIGPTINALKAAAAAALGNNPVTNADMASPPTLTASETRDAGLTVRAAPAVSPSSFRISGGRKWRRTVNDRLYVTTTTVFPSSTGTLRTSFPTAGTFAPEVPNPSGDTPNNWDVAFQTSSQVVEIEFQQSPSDRPYRLIVDGRYVARDGLIVDTSGKQFQKLTFPSRAQRTIIVEAQGGHLLGYVSVGPGETITAPPGPVLKGVVWGDSQTEALLMGNYGGVPLYWQWDGWFTAFGRRIGLGWTQNAAVGGTGYWNQSGGRPGTRPDIEQQMDYALTSEAWEIIAFAGGYNDAGQTTNADLRTRARACWVKARAANPQALIVVLGIFSGRTVSSDGSVRVTSEAALKAEFDAWADPGSMWIPVSPSYAGAWVRGTGSSDAPTGVGNADLYVSTDDTHYNRAGHLYNAEQAEIAYRAALALMV